MSSNQYLTKRSFPNGFKKSDIAAQQRERSFLRSTPLFESKGNSITKSISVDTHQQQLVRDDITIPKVDLQPSYEDTNSHLENGEIEEPFNNTISSIPVLSTYPPEFSNTISFPKLMTLTSQLPKSMDQPHLAKQNQMYVTPNRPSVSNDKQVRKTVQNPKTAMLNQKHNNYNSNSNNNKINNSNRNNNNYNNYNNINNNNNAINSTPLGSISVYHNRFYCPKSKRSFIITRNVQTVITEEQPNVDMSLPSPWVLNYNNTITNAIHHTNSIRYQQQQHHQQQPFYQ
ncbi:hypothetical protein PPL_10621 [Heterostelium album PN500]|uniref:Uncharacterized protein n=1 Tax=Heterostelium pallidum (strain ATCC 26659 / Pp 5 / PN500) TaxID=670386 RepID=D3BRL0_HETP5|nr:hypothetical protein PPL_10621 [Heterostelium album PN500]EFA76042.1 hypothetical protein PPL_10621 [Heterostelium album PN500]|eukprot:XP_020428176.1 hypothetical protein PPL_10621 [Heterostelium album PN500]